MKEKMTQFKNRKREEGLTLVEILVAVSLLAVISIIVVSLINSTMNSASRFGNVTSTQNEISNASSSIQKDLSNSQRVLKATDNSITVLVRQNNQDSEVTYFAYNPASPGTLPAGTIAARLPNYPALISVRKVLSSGKIGQDILVKGLNPEGFSSASKHHMFDYFDADNTEVGVPAMSSGSTASSNTLSNIKRVEFRIAANADGRGTPVQVESSATINSSKVSPSTGTPSDYNSVPLCPTSFRATVDVNNTPTTVTLNWYAPAGATSYTVYRTNVNTGVAETSTVIPDPTETELVVPSLSWGTTYTWNIQSNGPGGNSPVCTPGVTATIVPAQINFANINSLAALNSTKNGAGAETLNRPAETNIPAKNVTTQNILAGNRYTVARNLTNQLAWGTSYGTTGYRVYEQPNLTTPVATITTAGTQWAQIPANYGWSKQYVVRAYNAGGESPASFPVTLTSPPTASTVAVSDPDTSTRSTTTDSIVDVTTRAANTDGFRVRKNEGAVAATQNMCAPTTWAAVPSMNFTSAARVTDANAQWGTTSCYQLVPFNDAGEGIPTARSVHHMPGKFTFSTITNPTVMRVIDTNRGVSGQAGGLGLPYCWADRLGQAGSVADLNCKGDSTTSRADAYTPLGMFGTISNSYLSINVVWTQSHNAFKDYTVTRERIQSGNTVDQNPTVTTNFATPYVTGNQSALYSFEQPGSVYQFTVTAKAENDLTRQRYTQHLSRPDIPHSYQGNYHVKNLGGYNGTKSKTTVYLAAMRGGADRIDTSFDMSGNFSNLVTTSHQIAGAYKTVDSPFQTRVGQNKRYVTTYLTRTLTVIDTSNTTGAVRQVSVTQGSDQIGRIGALAGFTCPRTGPGSCNDADGKPFATGWPNYWSGESARYWSGGVAHGQDARIGNAQAVDAPPSDLGGGNDSNSCAELVEDSVGYMNGCDYGQGIPPMPTLSTTVSGTTHNVSWTSWPNVQNYDVTYRIAGGAETKVTKGAQDRTLSITVPLGQTATVAVKAKNNVAFSDTASVSVSTAPAAPTGVSATVSGTTVNVKWNAVTGATGYKVHSTFNGVTTVKDVSGTTTSYTGLAVGTYQYRVTALTGTIASAQSPVASATIATAPAVPTGLKITTVTDNNIGASWTAVPNATKYTVSYQHVASNTTKTVQVSGTTVVNIPITGSGTYRVSVRAENAAGASAYSAAVSVDTPQ